MENDNLKVFKRYSIAVESELGKKMMAYYNACKDANQAAADCLKEVCDKYGFVPYSDEIEIEPSVNGEAGGILCIYLPKDADESAIDPLVWDHFYNDTCDMNAWYPRVYVQKHYISYHKARQILKSKYDKVDQLPSVDDEYPNYMVETESETRNDITTYRPKKMSYEQVKHLMTTDDVKAIIRKGDIAPKNFAPVAPVTMFGICSEDGLKELISIDEYMHTQQFCDSCAIAYSFHRLPYVHNGQLMRILRLHSKSNKPTKEQIQAETNLKWYLDGDKFIVETGLVSDNKDMKEI